MKWTTEQPMEDGWYWLGVKSRDDLSTIVLEEVVLIVIWEDGTPTLQGVDCPESTPLEDLSLSRSVWAGPIRKPE